METCPTSPTFICNFYIKISVSKILYLFSIRKKSRCKPAWILIENLFSWTYVLFVLLAEFLIGLFWFRPTDLRGSLRVRPFSVGAILVRACSLCMLLRFFSRSGSPFHRRFIFCRPRASISASLTWFCRRISFSPSSWISAHQSLQFFSSVLDWARRSGPPPNLCSQVNLRSLSVPGFPPPIFVVRASVRCPSLALLR